MSIQSDEQVRSNVLKMLYIEGPDGTLSNPGSFEQWVTEMTNPWHRVSEVLVGEETVKVSTVFLGCRHNHLNPRGPMLYETMIVGGLLDQQIKRYPIRAEAIEGHDQIVIRLRVMNDIIGALGSVTDLDTPQPDLC